MDGLRFDNWTRKLSRRKAVAAMGATGVAAVMSKAMPATAQGDGVTCQMAVQALTSAGPSFGQAYRGVLELALGTEGDIDSGTFTPDGGVAVPVVGEFEGRALDLRITFADGQALVLSGTGANLIETCSGALSGIFSGPQLGDTGSWLIDPAASIVTVPSGSGGGDSPVASGTATATATPACPGVDCGSTFVVDPVTCECICAPPTERCGPVCCPGGSVCEDEPSGQCSCPMGSEICGNSCVESCPPQTYLDYDTCDCVEGCNLTCNDGQDLDPDKCLCIDICYGSTPNYCGGNCYAEYNIECSGLCYPLSDLDSNASMCGPSCTACPPGVPCIGGSCQCPATYSYCPGSGCLDLTNDSNNCGSCGVVCTGGNVCRGGTCRV